MLTYGKQVSNHSNSKVGGQEVGKVLDHNLANERLRNTKEPAHTSVAATCKQDNKHRATRVLTRNSYLLYNSTDRGL